MCTKYYFFSLFHRDARRLFRVTLKKTQFSDGSNDGEKKARKTVLKERYNFFIRRHTKCNLLFYIIIVNKL